MKKKALPILAVLGVIILIIAIMFLSKLVKKYTPTKERQNLSEYYNITDEDQTAIIFNHDLVEEQAKQIDGHLYLDYQFVHDKLNERFYWDANENILLYTTAKDLVSVQADSSTYLVSKTSNDFGRPIVKATADSAYIDIDFVKQYTDFSYSTFEDPSRLVISNEYGEITTASAKKNTELRVLGGIKSPILCDIAKGDKLTVVAADTKWTKVMSPYGIAGYIRTNALSDTSTETTTSSFTEETHAHIQKNFKINMAWHQVTNQTANNDIANVLGSTKGLNVISPTWFYLNNNNGEIASLASSSYVTYCHQHNTEVWALVSNLENSDVDSTYVLTHTSARQNLVNQIVSAAIQYDLDGINLDFESLSSDVGDGFIQLVRELSLKCSNNGIVLSVDNYAPYSFNAFYNRSEQAAFADYVILMGYDQHYAGSEEAGSVAALDWVKEGVANTLDEVPADQLILAMPFYTRVWSETPVTSDSQDAQDTQMANTENIENTEDTESGTQPAYTLDSYACGMKDAEKLADANGAKKTWLDDCGQYYTEYVNDGVTYKIWFEDASSIEKKLQVISDNKLAGASFWKLGFETSDIWDTVIKYIN